MTVAMVMFGCPAWSGFCRARPGTEGEERQEKIRLSLPDALDLMVVWVEAGNGLDQAIPCSQELAMSHKEFVKRSGWSSSRCAPASAEGRAA